MVSWKTDLRFMVSTLDFLPATNTVASLGEEGGLLFDVPVIYLELHCK